MRAVIGDADALIATVHDGDINHNRAIEITKKLKSDKIDIIFPNTAIIEAITALKRSLNLPEKSAYLNKMYQQKELRVEYVNEEIQMLASKYHEMQFLNKTLHLMP